MKKIAYLNRAKTVLSFTSLVMHKIYNDEVGFASIVIPEATLDCIYHTLKTIEDYKIYGKMNYLARKRIAAHQVRDLKNIEGWLDIITVRIRKKPYSLLEVMECEELCCALSITCQKVDENVKEYYSPRVATT